MSNNPQQPKLSVAGILDSVNQMSPMSTEGAREESKPQPTAAPKAPRKNKDELSFDETFKVGKSNATVALTVKVPNELHAKLLIRATQNKLARDGSPKSIQDLATAYIMRCLSEEAA